MADVQHSQLTDPSLHEPKGIASADANRVYVSNGVGGGSWTQVPNDALSPTANAFQGQLLHVRDEKPSGTAGGTFTSGSWVTRTLNTSLTNEITSASLGSNQITLPAGTYFIQATAPAYFIGVNKLRFQNITDGTTTLIGQNTSRVDLSNNVQAGVAHLTGRFTIAGTKVFELQHRGQTTLSTEGLGVPASLGVVEVYSEVLIWKIA